MRHRFMKLIRNLKTIAKHIKIPLDCFAGHCYEIADECLKHGLVPEGSKLRYGLWHGPMGKGKFKGRVFTHHAWIELPDGRIYDPTCWYFYDVKPEHAQAWVGIDDLNYYDVEAKNVGFEVPCPKFTGPEIKVSEKIQAYLPDGDSRVDACRLGWVANKPPSEMGDDARPVFEEIIKLGFQAFIPIDRRVLVFGE